MPSVPKRPGDGPISPSGSRLRDALTDDQRARLDAAFELILALGRRRRLELEDAECSATEAES
jgi:hypothetical protein